MKERCNLAKERCNLANDVEQMQNMIYSHVNNEGMVNARFTTSFESLRWFFNVFTYSVSIF